MIGGQIIIDPNVAALARGERIEAAAAEVECMDAHLVTFIAGSKVHGIWGGRLEQVVEMMEQVFDELVAQHGAAAVTEAVRKVRKL